jgi:tetratricopeptide (TPR) repeat protein
VGFVGVCYARAGRYDEAAAFNRRQEELAHAHADQRLLVEAFANRGTMHYFRGDYAAASEHLSTAVRVAEQAGLETDVALIRNNLGFVELQLGRRESAADHFARAVNTHTRNGALASLIAPCNGLGHVLRDEGRHDHARQYFSRALALAQESDDFVNVGVAYMNLGHCALLENRVREAQHELAVALNILEQTGFWNGLARVYEYMAELNLRLGNFADAIRCTERRVDLAQRHANRKMEAAAWRQKADALDRAGREDEAGQARAASAALEAGQAGELASSAR